MCVGGPPNPVHPILVHSRTIVRIGTATPTSSRRTSAPTYRDTPSTGGRRPVPRPCSMDASCCPRGTSCCPRGRCGSSHRATATRGPGMGRSRAEGPVRCEAGVEGRIVLIGEEPDPPYERPELSKGFLAGDKQRSDLAVKPEKWYVDNGVELLLARRATGLDRQHRVVHVDGSEQVGYDRLLIATGSAPRRLKVPGSDLDGVHYLRRVGNSEAIRAAIAAGGPIVVIGAGWIGLEVAAVARTAGVQVTLLESDPAPLYRVLGEQVGSTFVALHRDHGVDVRTRVEVRALRGDRRVEDVELGDGGSRQHRAV